VPALADTFDSIRNARPRSGARDSSTEESYEDDDRPARRRRDRWDEDDSYPSIKNRDINRDLILRFRREIHALGAFWIFIGCVAVGLSIICWA
jgi:hypothetical protein